ncbi:putative F1F0 ATP synthase assembly protein Atp11 [Aspergillus heteromorphus CBS 117.55]|uniref:Putative F1F0 ATP synthase assembly protein Atp11 n=1 Tax=Aspergillus heteromorphus CBS 117.55 TaxID=1448321 RepID=A0A317VXZ1_9EURO|nr:putative F1F0 ATP synthase assembly protein Atp11 [Aspergillus heteromorphus CBS 117.55]PWY79224.1 putative F1F0 ATP synthase assembly protein Atp11 [Aspergillus heteromorphus CBS 117.55]
MASLRSSAFQSLLRSRNSFLHSQQKRWAQVHDVRFLATHHDPNQVLERYRSKLKEKAHQEGHENVDSLKEAYQDKIDDLRPRAATAAKSTGIKPLDSFIDVEKVRHLPPKEIEAIWRLRHAGNSQSICAVIPVETYQRIASVARQNPQFILPLPRTQPAEGESDAPENTGVGADIHFLQWAFHPPASAPSTTASPGSLANAHTSTIIFTPLAAYKLHGSFAQPHTTITHHLDLADDKGLVLMHGQVMPDSGVSSSEASWLVSCVQRFYDFEGQASGRKGELLRMFTQGDVQGFKIEDLLAEAEKL